MHSKNLIGTRRTKHGHDHQKRTYRAALPSRTNLKRTETKKAIQEFLDQVIIELKKGNRLEFRDFGVFEVKERAARLAQNPKTMQKVEVPAKRAVKFKVGRLMRESVEVPGLGV